MSDRERRYDVHERMQDLLSGKVPQDNLYVEYALGKMRECLARKKALTNELNEARTRLELLEMEALRLETEFDKYGEDVAHFDPIIQKLKKAS